MYEGDTPNAERRAAALSLDRDLLRELLGSEELRELIDPAALARVEDDLQHRSEMTRATDRDTLHDVLRRVGDLNLQEITERVFAGIDPDPMLRELQHERRAIRLRLGGDERYVAADEAGLYRDALGAVPPGGLPDAYLEDVPDALSQIVARYARTHGPFTGEQLRARYGVDASAVLRELERAGGVVRGELRPGEGVRAQPSEPSARRSSRQTDEREWCDADVLRRAPCLPRRTAKGDRAGRPAQPRCLHALLAGSRSPRRRGRGDRPAARGAGGAAGSGAAC
jgi:ATP-dependent Lhr-like helicase